MAFSRRRWVHWAGLVFVLAIVVLGFANAFDQRAGGVVALPAAEKPPVTLPFRRRPRYKRRES